MLGCRGPVTGSGDSQNPVLGHSNRAASDTAATQSEASLKTESVLLVIDHRAMRSALLKIAATDSITQRYRASRSEDARRFCALLHRPAMSGRDNSAA